LTQFPIAAGLGFTCHWVIARSNKPIGRRSFYAGVSVIT